MRTDGPFATIWRRATDESTKFFVGLDTHKDSVALGICELGRERARFVGTISPDIPGVLRALRKYGPPQHVRVVYEAGPTGFGLYRALNEHGYSPDNATCEGFFGRLKTELFYSRSWMSTTIEEFVAAADSYIRWYNEARIKISLGFCSPIEHRRNLGLAA